MPRLAALAACIVALMLHALRAQNPHPRVVAEASPALSTLPAMPASMRQGGEPKDIADLRAMQAHVEALIALVLPATVTLPGATGVIVDGGYVLSAAHVTSTAGRKLPITLHDGRRIEGVTLGADHRSDAGLIRITTEGQFPSRPLGKSAQIERGQWCLMLGHPSGTKPGRAAPARLGRVLIVPERGYLITDCTMQSGDSGGPLFDMDGKVIGINSRINENLAQNMHVPVDAFTAGWDDLVAGKTVEPPRGRRGAGPRLGFGVTLDFEGKHPRVTEVAAGSSAAEAGLLPGDHVTKVDGRDVVDRRGYARALSRRAAGDEIVLRVQRGDESLDVKVKLQQERQ